jgi:hypothetical protein
MFLCDHKLGEVKDNYQYCTKCGKAFIVECSHKWIQISTIQVPDRWGQLADIGYVLQCTKCGDMKNHKVNN